MTIRLFDTTHLTHLEIADIFGVTRSRIQQIEERANTNGVLT